MLVIDYIASFIKFLNNQAEASSGLTESEAFEEDGIEKLLQLTGKVCPVSFVPSCSL